MNNQNPKIDTQVYDVCAHSWRMMHLWFFYARIPDLIGETWTNELISWFNFPKLDENWDDYQFQKYQIDINKTWYEPVSWLNYFSSFILHNSLRDIFSAFYEGLCKEEHDFRNFIQNILGEEHYDDYRNLVKFLRHFFSHNIDNEMRIHGEDIGKMKKNWIIINLNINSEKMDLNWPLINLNISLNFNKINAWDKLISLITIPQVIKLADFYSRLSLEYIHYKTSEEIKKSSQKAR